MEDYLMQKAAHISKDADLNTTQDRPVEHHLKAIENGLNALKDNLRYIPSEMRSDAHVRLRDGWAGLDSLRVML